MIYHFLVVVKYNQTLLPLFASIKGMVAVMESNKNLEAFGEMLMERLKHKGKSQTDLAFAVDRSQSHISLLGQGRLKIEKQPYSFFAGLIRFLGVTQADFERFGVYYPPSLFESVANAIPEGFKTYPLAGVANGGRAYDPEIREIVLRAQTDLRPNSLLFGIVGSSMEDPREPEGLHSLKDGDFIWADPAFNQPNPGQVFVFKVANEGYTVKKLELLGSSWWMRSYNEVLNPPREVQWDSTEIVGVVYLKVPTPSKYRAK
jgi:phage repressor protein C with HTH and peptisase S24 domain